MTDGPCITWHLKSGGEADSVRSSITEVVSLWHNRDLELTDDSVEVLFEEPLTGLTLWLGNCWEENAIHAKKLEGTGRILPLHGPELFLFLMAIQQHQSDLGSPVRLVFVVNEKDLLKPKKRRSFFLQIAEYMSWDHQSLLELAEEKGMIASNWTNQVPQNIGFY